MTSCAYEVGKGTWSGEARMKWVRAHEVGKGTLSGEGHMKCGEARMKRTYEVGEWGEHNTYDL